MFEFIRTHQRLMQLFLLILIVPSFVLVGISGYMRGGGESTVAEVGGDKISQLEFDDAMRDRINQMRQRLGERFDEAMFKTPEAKQAVLDNLISQHALKAAVRNANLSVSDATLQKAILEIPGVIKADGSFDKEMYARLLAMQGVSQVGYEAGLRQNLAQDQLIDAIRNTAFASKTLIEQVDLITSQQREVQVLTIKDVDFVSQVKLTDAMIKDYYDKNGAQFELPETAKIDYVVFSAESLTGQVAVSDDEVNQMYQANLKNYTTDEQRRASHILIKVAKDASAADKAAAKAKAEQVLALVKKSPGNFAELAKQYSQDDGSAPQGGDLDFFGKGMMTKPFEDAVFKLKQDEISDLVQSDFGYHIIRLTGIRAATVKTLDQVKPDIVADVKKKKADKLFSEMAETFTNTVYEQPDSLKPVADKLKLTIQSADHVTRTPGAASFANPILANPKFLKALFVDDVIKNKHNMEAVDLGNGTMVSAHIVEYKAASKRPLEEVRDVVSARVTALQADELAAKAGAAKLAELLAKPELADAAGFKDTVTVSRSQPGTVPRAGFDAIMRADARKLPAFAGATVPGMGYQVYRITKLIQPGVDAGRTDDIARQVEGVNGSENLYDFVNQLKKNGKATVTKALKADTSGS